MEGGKNRTRRANEQMANRKKGQRENTTKTKGKRDNHKRATHQTRQRRIKINVGLDKEVQQLIPSGKK